MKRIGYILILSLTILHPFCYPQCLSYEYLIELGREALICGDYKLALHYFDLAHLLIPAKEEPILKFEEKKPIPKKSLQLWERRLREKRKTISKSLDLWEKRLEKEKVLKLAKVVPPKKVKEEVRVLYLTDELYKTQPKTVLEIEVEKSLILEGRTIARFLVERPEVLEVSRIDADRVLVRAKRIGSTFLHLWEEHGRWTFNVKVIPPFIVPPKKVMPIVEVEPFKIEYRADWSSYYRDIKGGKLRNIERESLSFTQWLGISGPTPYGDVDGSLRATKYGEKQEITAYTLGLTDGRIGPIEDFNLRGFDFSKSFSRLSLRGASLYGVSWEQSLFAKKFDYSLFWGKERAAYYGYVAPGIFERRKSYLEGVRLDFSPTPGQRYAYNFAKGYGRGRQEYLPSEVYSLEGWWKLKDMGFNGEIAFDGDSWAGYLGSSFNLDNLSLNLNFRDIEKNFSTITGWPGDRGEIGVILGVQWEPKENLAISSNLDIYRARYMYNEAKPKELNYDWNTNLSLILDPISSLNASLYYVNEPGLSFPRRYLNLRTTYSREVQVLGKKIRPFLGWGFARSRNPLSPTSDYDTYKLFCGARFPLIPDLSFYLNFDYNWLEEKLTKERDNPFVWEMGLDYQKKLSPLLTANVLLRYRNEESAQLPHSFLSGEDSLEGSLRLEYTPMEEVETYLEGRLRNVWAQTEDKEDYIELDLRWGISCTWDTFFSWSPQGRVSGIVFKDLNGDGKRDEDEPLLEGIKVMVGTKEVVTDEEGRFSIEIMAKKVIVKIDQGSLPEGYILTTPSSSEVEIIQGRDVIVNFGASSFSTIYGVVFYDTNSNQKFDPQDQPLPYVRLLLEDKKTFTNLEGSYYFRHLKEGRYKLRLDIDTVPIEYIPTVPLEKEIELAEGVRYLYSFPLRKK
jgi:hypothetical protein